MGVVNGSKAQVLLLDLILKYSGGTTEVARVMEELFEENFSRQRVNVYKEGGWIPLKYAVRLAKKLGVPMLALNFDDGKVMLGSKDSWTDIVKKVKFLTPAHVKEVLSQKGPKV